MMARDDWFRNADWNESIEKAFFAELDRVRNKQQYLRIQAYTIARSHPRVALRLLDEYFRLGKHFDYPQAHIDRAAACLALGDCTQAILSYEAALAFEERRPNFTTQAYIDLPFVVACQGIVARYEQALQLLKDHQSRLTFPVEYFRWNSAYALIAAEVGLAAPAREHAQSALHAESKQHSGFRDHPRVGLVEHGYESLCRRLCVLATQPHYDVAWRVS
jgi:tetratricopeptide (TPR) repeat protein